VFINLTNPSGQAFLASGHGPEYAGNDPRVGHPLACQHCHAGANDGAFTTMAEAHEGMIAHPSAAIGVSPEAAPTIGCNVAGCHQGQSEFADLKNPCEKCHTTHVDNWAQSLHANLGGEKAAIENRCSFDNLEDTAYWQEFKNQCAECHATCGQCHVSRPLSAGSGFVHLAEATVSRSHLFGSPGTVDGMKEQCTACHGTRVATDYLGEGTDVPADHSQDIHWVRRSMTCTGCHTGAELHGDGTPLDHRYEVADMPRCEDCHGAGKDADWSNNWHDKHVDGGPGDSKLQCQVCHAQPYRNCNRCHDPGTGTEYEQGFDLKIAANDAAAFPYRQDMGYDYVLVRHVPIARDTYAHWGLADLPNFTDRPTWFYASPHSIIKNTDQASGCSSCHSGGYYLSDADLTTTDEQAANANLVVPPRK
jgi:thiosulfate/3-mercaptopyruvate sulfurtransferase